MKAWLKRYVKVESKEALFWGLAAVPMLGIGWWCMFHEREWAGAILFMAYGRALGFGSEALAVARKDKTIDLLNRYIEKKDPTWKS